jgi:hypothetical protein
MVAVIYITNMALVVGLGLYVHHLLKKRLQSVILYDYCSYYNMPPGYRKRLDRRLE